jgi:purine-nucleoside/S-methyl-5'-thioadenosine phosphorylase / adenosine deaminase
MNAAELAVELPIELPGAGHALFTTRAEGNLSTATGDGHEQGLQRRAALCERLGLRWLCSSRQTHGTSVNTIEEILADAGTPLPIDADAHLTALHGVGTLIMSADCLPIALGAASAVAMVHAGWRGLAAGVVENGVEALRELAGGRPIGAVIGPGAGACCYEVGPEVHEALATGVYEGKGHIDLRAIAHQRLRDAGVGEIRHLDACTICDERFFSHRREGAHAGRQGGIAWLS